MIYELFLEGEIADIRQDLGMQLSFNIDDVNKYGSRDTSFSKTIVLPGTAKNNRLLGFVAELGSNNPYTNGAANINSNFNAAQTTKAELRANGLLLLKGVFRLTGIIKERDMIEYEGNLFGELGGFIAAIGAGKLEELDFSAYNHTYSRDSIVNSWDGKITKSIRVNFSSPNIIIIQSYSLDLKLNANDIVKITDAAISGNNQTYTVTGYVPPDPDVSFGFIAVQESVSSSSNDDIILEYTTPAGNGYYYPLIDHGTYSTNKIDYDYRTFRPALFVKEYIDRMFLGSGYTYESSFLNTSFFKRLIVPCNFAKLTKRTSDLLLATRSKTNLFEGLDIVVSPFWLGFDNISYNVFTIEYPQGGNVNYPIYKYTSPDPAIVTIEFSIKAFIKYGTNANHRFRYGIKKNNDNVNYKEIFYPQQTPFVLKSYNLNDSITVEIQLNQNDYIWFPIENQNVAAGSFIETASVKVDSLNPITADVTINDSISINNIIPRNILQKDFFVWIMKMFNLYITEDKLKEKHLLIEPYVEYYDLSDSIDWTYKTARDKPWNIKPMGMLNGRFFEYKYKEDNDFYNEGYKKKYNIPYGSRLEDTFFQFAKEKQTIDIGFSPSVLIQYQSTDKVVTAIYKKSSGSSVDQEERMDSNIRILMAKKITGVDSWSIIDTGSGQVFPGTALGAALTAYGYAGHFDDPVNPTKDINFGAADEIYFDPNVYPTNNLFNNYWSAYIGEIADKDSKLLTCHVYLNDLDIAQLDFSKPVFIDGVLWRINKVMDYDATSGELTKVELLKVININFGLTCIAGWTTENYSGTTFRNGDPIPEVTDDAAWAALTTPAWCHHDNDPDNGGIYGKLYNWYAINDPRGFAPEGYRVATYQDVLNLENCLGGEELAGGKMKSTSSLWDAPNTGATNESGFNGLPGGIRSNDGNFQSIYFSGRWWTSSEFDGGEAYFYGLNYDSSGLIESPSFKNIGFSVRLIKEN